MMIALPTIHNGDYHAAVQLYCGRCGGGLQAESRVRTGVPFGQQVQPLLVLWCKWCGMVLYDYDAAIEIRAALADLQACTSERATVRLRQLSLSPEDMGFLEYMTTMRQWVCSAFGVPLDSFEVRR